MKALASLRTAVSRGSKALPFQKLPLASSGSNLWGNNLLPGASNMDFVEEAGDLWDNSVIRSLLKWREDVAGDCPWTVFAPGAEGPTPVRPHPLTDILHHPNPLYNGSVLESAIIQAMILDGNAYLLKLYSELGALSGFIYLPYFATEPAPLKDGTGLAGYLYSAGGRRWLIPPEYIVHLRDGYNHENPFKGLSRTGAVLRSVVADNEVDTLAAVLMKNRGIPAVILSPKLVVEDEEVWSPERAKRLKEKWKNEVTGSGRGEPLVASVPMDVVFPSYSFNDMALDRTNRLFIAKICAAGNVDPMVLGLPAERKTYANMKEATRGAYEQCIFPGNRRIDGQLTEQVRDEVLGMGKEEYLSRDYTGVKALQDDLNDLYTNADAGYTGGFLKRKDARRLVGLDYDDIADDVYLTDLQPAASPSPTEPVQNPKGARLAQYRRAIAAEWRAGARHLPAREE